MYALTLAGIPISIGANEAVHQQRLLDEEAEADERQEEFYLDVYCDAKSRKKDEVNGAIVVLKDGKVRLWPKDPNTGLPKDDPDDDEAETPHPFTGFYLPFPSDDLPTDPCPQPPSWASSAPYRPHSTRVKTDSKAPSKPSSPKPKLNWLYVDKRTREVKYGPRTEAKKHVVGHWDWTEDDEQGITLEGEESLVAVEEESGVWVGCVLGSGGRCVEGGGDWEGEAGVAV
ncbi:hypothetical protein N0V83_007977 [Neocucurbitaria cava]|uniref:Uncharacterized protein n=1 Tax=Neocucurbitaria cava TaxID=798079 RepID=A0A9W8Y472_9PLEO|nr:hypothetical protein N0V83_007977 [Neocucurbitaria cava]